MNIELVVALVAGVFALGSAIVSAVTTLATTRIANRQQEQREDIERLKEEELRREHKEDRVSPFREPLAQAAFDLQSRIYNIMAKNFISLHFSQSDERERRYAVENTTFLICQLFCWIEITRRKIQFIDLETHQATRKMSVLQNKIQRSWASDSSYSSHFKIFSGEQRAIGEALIEVDGGRPRCMGYGRFLKDFSNNDNILIDLVRKEVAGLDRQLSFAEGRLRGIHHALIDLINFLDPDELRFPAKDRTRV